MENMENPLGRFQVGDSVRLCCGGPILTVISVGQFVGALGTKRVECCWWNDIAGAGMDLRMALLPPEALEPIERRKPDERPAERSPDPSRTVTGTLMVEDGYAGAEALERAYRRAANLIADALFDHRPDGSGLDRLTGYLPDGRIAKIWMHPVVVERIVLILAAERADGIPS